MNGASGVPWSSFLDYLRRDAPQPEAASAFLMSGFHYYVSQIEVSKKGSIAIKGQHRPLIAKETFWDVWTSEYMDKNHALRHATPTPVVGEHERMGLNKRPPRGGIWEHKIYYAFKVATPPGRELDKYLLAQCKLLPSHRLPPAIERVQADEGEGVLAKQFRDAWVQIKRQHNREGQNSMPELYVKTILQAASKYTIDKIDHWPHSGTGRAAVGPLGHVGNTNPYTHDWPGLDDQRRLVRVGGTMKLEKFFRTGHA